MPATIRELINADILRAVLGIRTSDGYSNDVGAVAWAHANGDPPTFPDVQGLFVVLTDNGDEPRDTSPISKDDYNASITVDVSHVESLDSDTTMNDRNAGIWADVKKALMSDRNRGTHPTNGGPLAFNTLVGTPRPFDSEQGQGISVPVTIWFRTSKDDPYSQ